MKTKILITILLITFSAFGQTEIIITGGVQDNNTSINNVLSDAINTLSSNGTITIKGNIFINDDFTIPTGIELNFFKGNIFILANGIELTLNGTINARQYQIFDGDGVVTGNSFEDAAYPEWFGAIGNGIANDGLAISKTLNLSSQINWDGTYHSSTDIVINDSIFNIYKLKLKNTSLIIDSSSKSFINNTVSNLSIKYDSLSNNSYGLHLKRTGANSVIRDMLISNIYIENCDKAIYANPDDKFHSLGTITITNSVLRNNNISIYFDENDETLPNIINSINDIKIKGNIFYSIVKDVYMKSADGVVISDNTFFGNSGNKTKSIHIANNLSDQIKIHGNQIFEPQEEGILVEKVKSFQIDNNNIVASVNLNKLSSKIRIQTTGNPIESTIRGNIIRKATTNGIEIKDISTNQNLTQSIFVNSNVIYTQAHGIVEGEDLANMNHYGILYDGKYIYLNGVNHSLKEEKDENDNKFYTEISNFDIKNQIERRNNFSKYPSNNILNKTISFDNTNTKDLLKFNGDRYSYFVKIHCWRHGKEAIEKSNVNSSTYLLLISETVGNREEVALISELGLAKFGTNPDSWIPDNWPAFNFSISNNILSVSHKNGKLITDEFSFEIIKIGNGRID